MTMSQTASFLTEVTKEFDVIPADKLAYLQERLRNRLYELVLTEFMRHQATNPHFTQAALARRIGSRPDMVNRWLSSPGNWTTDTVSNLLAGICGAELGISINKFEDYVPTNYDRPKWLDGCNSKSEAIYKLQPPPSGSVSFDTYSKTLLVHT